PYISTVETAKDMDELREHLGEDTVSYLGYSYGTFLGALYADAFPDRVRAAVLDGAVDPASDAAAVLEGQALGFESELDAFLAWCASDAKAAFHGGGDAAGAYDELVAAIDAAPLGVVGANGATRTMGPGELYFGVTDALYDQAEWKALAEALAAAEAGDG